ncbi:MAG TPA: glycoside hydrolase family 3 C-terminal domain-containing protein [Actinophytocola sp.]|uniref:beta-glucosidase family protein n=1 Tax=Actinophytocola sp. TaxID=1872138 RepID=UPI002DBA65AD|nr:glycoside hydrolase family 3 C-terminal domain-containing protein [Actinophytocola sp.]HEU5469850.1 glycoside hydrolase family 3 C-terminal domain-containing protein [Actinophytocola sp.]
MTETELRDRLTRLSLAEKVRLLTGADFWTLHAEPAIGLRRLVVSDGPAGVRGRTWDERDPSANVPSPTTLAATWDETRVERLGRLLAAEARRKGVDVLLAPTVNLHRTPYGGRHFECFSEDPVLTGRIGAAYVRGLQSQGVGATVKHFVANDSETQRHTVDVVVDERTLRELYLAPFETIVREAGVWSVMAAYNSVNGHTMTESPLLHQILHREWGFDGLTMTDWYAGRTLAGATAGLDLIMPGPAGPWGEALIAAVRAGEIDEALVDDKVLRLLRLAARVGALDGVPGVPARPWTPEEISAELRASAAAGFVLARNVSVAGAQPLLPLDVARLRRVAVLGANAAVARTLGGGSATVFPPYTISPLDGLRAALGPDVTVEYGRGGRISARVPVADPALLRRPDGQPGARIRLLAADGTELGTQDRASASYKWMSSFGAGIAISDVAEIEVHTRLHPPRPGRYLVGASGVGAFRLTVDGTVVAEHTLVLPPGADFVESVMRPPQLIAPVDLSGGSPADLVVRYVPASATGLGAATVEAVTFQLNADRDSDDDTELAEAAALAADADLVVVVVGTTEEVESEGFDRTTLALPGRQDELVALVAAANPRTVVIANSGAPVLLPWADDIPAILLTWFPGQEFGSALADVLTGVTEPGGRLPVTWPADEHDLPTTTPVDATLRYTEGLDIGHRHYDATARTPLFPFGHGLGYTTWHYLAARPTPTGLTVRLRNTGSRAGSETIQVYASKPDTTISRPPRWLVAWTIVTARPGEEATADISLPARSFQHWAGGGWHTEPGTYLLHIGHSSRELPITVETSP